MPDAIAKLNEELQRDFPAGRLTHEPIFPSKHRDINDAGDTRDVDRLAQIVAQLDDHRSRIRVLLKEAAELLRKIGAAL